MACISLVCISVAYIYVVYIAPAYIFLVLITKTAQARCLKTRRQIFVRGCGFVIRLLTDRLHYP